MGLMKVNKFNELRFICDLMTQAEKNYEDGLDGFETEKERKAWIMSMIDKSTNSVDYDIDIDALSKLIDHISVLTKKSNSSISK